MSDLQCAARLVVLNPRGVPDLPSLVVALAREKIAAVYTAHDEDCLLMAQQLGPRLAVTVCPLDGHLADASAEFEQVIDRHRGETVVLVRPGRATAPVLLLVDSDAMTSRPFGYGG